MLQALLLQALLRSSDWSTHVLEAMLPWQLLIQEWKKQFVSVTIRISGEFHHSFQRAEKRNLRAALAIRLIIVRNTSGFIAEDVNSYKNFH